MPFKDNSGITCINMSDLWDEPLSPGQGDTLVPGQHSRFKRNSKGQLQILGLARVAYLIVLDMGPLHTNKNAIRNWRYGPYAVGEDEDPEAVALENKGELVSGRHASLDDAIDYALELNVAAFVMDS
jgi:hypothetical protein